MRLIPDYWTFSKIETYKVFKNLIGLGTKQKCPVVWVWTIVYLLPAGYDQSKATVADLKRGL